MHINVLLTHKDRDYSDVIVNRTKDPDHPFGFDYMDELDCCKVKDIDSKNWEFEVIIDNGDEIWWNYMDSKPYYTYEEAMKSLCPEDYCTLFDAHI
jgi:hypothetical protein